MQRYFGDFNKNNIILSEDDIFHIVKVMRSKVGDKIEVVVDEKLYLTAIQSLSPFSLEILGEKIENHELAGYVRLLYCIPKGEKLDLVVQKAVELGASEIVLVNSSRCVRKIEKLKNSSKLVRYNKIIKEASQQCKRTKLMKLTDIIDYEEINNYVSDESFIAYEQCDDDVSKFYDSLKSIKGKIVNILIGAEGGFSTDEVFYAKQNGYKAISLGKRILRSETSCLYVLSLFSFFMEQ